MSGVAWKLAGYSIERLLGAGASGEVWRARVNSTGEPVALKRIPLTDPTAVLAARAEAAKLATLDHPHLVRLHRFVPADGAIVLVVDLAGGGSLADLVTARGRLTPGEVISAVAPIAAALAYAHTAGVVHGDVTPANVVFTQDGLPLLTDLGVSRLVGDEAAVLSTPAFVDPSVAAGCVPAAASDVFMVGGLALYALTGRPVWTGESSEDALAAAASGQLDGVADWLRAAGVPEQVAAVVCRALSVEPSLRGTAADFALDLRHAGTPVAVELAAGQARGEPSRAARDDEAADRAAPPAGRHAAVPGRPPFERPPARHAVGQPPLTHGVRVPTPRAFAGARREVWWRRPRVRQAGMGAALAVVLAALIAGAVWWRAGASQREVGATASSPAPSERPAGLDADSAATVLARLDSYREQAYAHRDPRLLARVYVAGPLLAEDSALLTRIVPQGCGLLGVRTGYRDVRVERLGPDRTEISVQATLAASRLQCAGTPGARAAGTGPTPLRVVVAKTPSGYALAAVRSGG
ncbi:MAG: serine/threonine-protein kinase [Jatrophihabitantaceae bacterium]